MIHVHISISQRDMIDVSQFGNPKHPAIQGATTQLFDVQATVPDLWVAGALMNAMEEVVSNYAEQQAAAELKE